MNDSNKIGMGETAPLSSPSETKAKTKGGKSSKVASDSLPKEMKTGEHTGLRGKVAKKLTSAGQNVKNSAGSVTNFLKGKPLKNEIEGTRTTPVRMTSSREQAIIAIVNNYRLPQKKDASSFKEALSQGITEDEIVKGFQTEKQMTKDSAKKAVEDLKNRASTPTMKGPEAKKTPPPVPPRMSPVNAGTPRPLPGVPSRQGDPYAAASPKRMPPPVPNRPVKEIANKTPPARPSGSLLMGINQATQGEKEALSKEKKETLSADFRKKYVGVDYRTPDDKVRLYQKFRDQGLSDKDLIDVIIDIGVMRTQAENTINGLKVKAGPKYQS